MQENDTSTDNYTRITDKTVITAALERVINSPEFKDSKRSIQLLNYIVEKALAGETAQINGTTIAQDVLRAGIDFDPSTNPIVRVQAGRLRKLLSEYYRRSGKNDDVLIYVAKGQYAPQFGKYKELRPIIRASSSKQTYSLRETGKWLAIGLAAVTILVSLFYGLRNNSSNTTLSTRSNDLYPSIAILPFQNLTNDPSKDVFKQGFQHQLGTDLSRFRAIRVVFSDLQYEEIIAQKIPIADYVVEGTFLSIEDDIDLLIKFINLSSGKTVSQHRVNRKSGDESYYHALENISSSLSERFAGQDGVIVADKLKIIKNNLDLQNHQHSNIEAFACLSVFHKFESTKSEENFNHAIKCLQDQVAKSENDSTLLSALAWTMTYGSAETGLNIEIADKKDHSLTKALEYAQKAIVLDPGNSLAYEYLALIQWRRGENDAAIQSLRRSIQLNPAATRNLSNLGLFLCVTGNWKIGLETSQRAIELTPNAPYWYYTSLFLRAVLDKDAKAAMEYAQKHGHVAGADGGAYILIAASLANDQQTIDKYVPIVQEFANTHKNDPLYSTRRWVQSATIVDALESELKKVGIFFPNN